MCAQRRCWYVRENYGKIIAEIGMVIIGRVIADSDHTARAADASGRELLASASSDVVRCLRLQRQR